MTLIRYCLALLMLAATAGQALASAQSMTYAPAAFQEAQAAGTTMVVDVYADWCPVCRKQAPIIEELRSEAGLERVLFVRVDYDRHKDFLAKHRIPRQSTILVFRGDRELARSIAETDRDRLRAVVLGAVAAR